MNFVGLQVNVKLKPPSSWRIRGEVVHVEAQKLKLQNGSWEIQCRETITESTKLPSSTMELV